MKNTSSFLLILAFALSASAKPHDCIIVYLTDGSYAVFPTEKKPRITFEGPVVSISDERWQIFNIKKYTIGDSEVTGIVDVNGGRNLKGYSVKDGRVYVRLSDAKQSVRLFALDGKELPLREKPNANGVLCLPLPSQSGSVLLLQIGSETLKIRKP